MVQQSAFHCRGNAQRGMYAAEVVIHEPERHSRRVVLDFLRERIREASESANAHPHRKVLALNKTGTDMFRIRIAAHNLHVAANTLRGGIACVILEFLGRTSDSYIKETRADRNVQ